MKASWTVSRLLKEYPACRKVLLDYELMPRAIARWTLARVAEELEEDEDDFLDELDHAAQSLSEYDPSVVGDDEDDLDDLSVDDDDDGDDELEEDEGSPMDDESPLGDADDNVTLEDDSEDDDEDDDEF